MEDSESETIFDQLNLNPQLFINEILNTADDIIDEGFEFFEQQALERLGGANEEEDDAVLKGISSIRNRILEASNKRLGMWEKYCFQHCFSVPEGLSLPKTDTSVDNFMELDTPAGSELDNQLDSLREKLSAATKESNELKRELHTLKKQSITDSCAQSVTDVLKPFEQVSVQNMFREVAKKAAELRDKMENLDNKRMVEMEATGRKRIYNLNEDQTSVLRIKGLSDEDLHDLQEHLADLKNRVPPKH